MADDTIPDEGPEDYPSGARAEGYDPRWILWNEYKPVQTYEHTHPDGWVRLVLWSGAATPQGQLWTSPTPNINEPGWIHPYACRAYGVYMKKGEKLRITLGGRAVWPGGVRGDYDDWLLGKLTQGGYPDGGNGLTLVPSRLKSQRIRQGPEAGGPPYYAGLTNTREGDRWRCNGGGGSTTVELSGKGKVIIEPGDATIVTRSFGLSDADIDQWDALRTMRGTVGYNDPLIALGDPDWQTGDPPWYPPWWYTSFIVYWPNFHPYGDPDPGQTHGGAADPGAGQEDGSGEPWWRAAADRAATATTADYDPAAPSGGQRTPIAATWNYRSTGVINILDWGDVYPGYAGQKLYLTRRRTNISSSGGGAWRGADAKLWGEGPPTPAGGGGYGGGAGGPATHVEFLIDGKFQPDYDWLSPDIPINQTLGRSNGRAGGRWYSSAIRSDVDGTPPVVVYDPDSVGLESGLPGADDLVWPFNMGSSEVTVPWPYIETYPAFCGFGAAWICPIDIDPVANLGVALHIAAGHMAGIAQDLLPGM